MKTTMFLTAVLALTPLAFGQDTKQQQPPAEKKSLSQLQDEWRQQDNKRAVERVGEARKLTEEWLTKYNEQVATRAKLTEKLKRALADGDETLIQVAISDLNGNRFDLDRSAEWAIEKEGHSLLEFARSAYTERDDKGEHLISEEVYTEHLNFYRKMKVHMEEPLPVELKSLIKQAREKIPTFFAILEDVHGPIKTWQ